MEGFRKMTDLENKLDEIIKKIEKSQKLMKLLQESLKVEFELIDKRLNELEEKRTFKK